LYIKDLIYFISGITATKDKTLTIQAVSNLKNRRNIMKSVPKLRKTSI